MPAQGRVLYRSKQVSRLLAGIPLVFALILVVFGGLLGSGALAPAPQLLSLLAFGLAGLCGFVGLTMSGLRSALTSEELRIQFGLWGPRIPLDAITSCKVVDYDVRKYGGYGLKVRNGVRIYSAPGCQQAIELCYNAVSGDEQRVVFTADDPVAMAEQIQRARKARAAPRAPMRIEVDGEADAEAEAEEAARAEQEEAQRQATERSAG